MNKRNHTIEFYRFLFSLIVCVYHFRTYVPSSRYPFDSGYLAVEFFFMLSGIFLAQATQRKHTLSLEEKVNASIHYFLNRFRRLYPHYLFAIFCVAIVRILIVQNLTVETWLRTGISEILMFQSAGTGKQLSFVFWFSSALVMASFFVYFLRLWNPSVCKILFPLVSVGIYSSLLQKCDSFNVTFSYHFLFSDGFWRALAGIMMGCLCYEVIQYLRIIQLPARRKLFTIIEILLLSVIVILLYLPRYRETNYVSVLLFGLFLVLIFSQISHLSVLLNNAVSQYLGKISYAIYLNQIVVYTVIFDKFPPTEHTSMKVATAIYLVIVVILSVCTTWIVEKLESLITHKTKLILKR